jgi:hypothetical protein
VLGIDSSSVAALEGPRWRPFSGVGQAKLSFLCVKLEARKVGRKKIKAEEGEADSLIRAGEEGLLKAANSIERLRGDNERW